MWLETWSTSDGAGAETVTANVVEVFAATLATNGVFGQRARAETAGDR